ncbi:MAG: hypothetical protein LBM99_01590 [Bacillales bacterium]|jgi:hypothetical protein|nr:hypothetical protein [Bacillales bacterium]
MKIIIGNPGSGKTKKILEYSAEHMVPVLCESTKRVQRLLDKSQGYGLKIPTPIYYKELNGDVKAVLIDDVERLLKAVFSLEISVVTINNTDNVEIIDIDKK